MQANKTIIAAVVVASAFAVAPSTVKAAEPEQVVDALNAVFGKQGADMRASHAKGQCVTGRFAPTPEAKSLTRSATFEQERPVLARFSMGGGNPKIPDATKAAVRGFGIRIDPDGKASSEFVVVNAPMHFAKNTDQMAGFLLARVAGADGKPDPAKIKAFTDANPETTRQGAYLTSKPTPASYAGVNYWAIHAFSATNASGATQLVKFKFVPQAGELGLTDDEAKAKPADFLSAELAERLAKGPARFDMLAIMGRAGDGTTDPTQPWDDEDKRPTVKLGVLSISALADAKICDAGFFDPTNLADGIAGPTGDSIFSARQLAYAISTSRRTN